MSEADWVTPDIEANLILDFYDGPRAGILFLRNGGLWRYETAWENVEDDVRLFSIVELSSRAKLDEALKAAADRLLDRASTRNALSTTAQDESDIALMLNAFEPVQGLLRKYALCHQIDDSRLRVLPARTWDDE